jgi:serine/threonine protein kinase
LKAIERLHNIGYIHLDIKPDNILLDLEERDLVSINTSTHIYKSHIERHGKKIRESQFSCKDPLVRMDLKASQAHIIDFGTAERYTERHSKIHLPNLVKENPDKEKKRRNLYFASKHHFSGNTLSRRDDII